MEQQAVLIESDWNLKHEEVAEAILKVTSINRIRLEFKVHSGDQFLQADTGY